MMEEREQDRQLIHQLANHRSEGERSSEEKKYEVNREELAKLQKTLVEYKDEFTILLETREREKGNMEGLADQLSQQESQLSTFAEQVTAVHKDIAGLKKWKQDVESNKERVERSNGTSWFFMILRGTQKFSEDPHITWEFHPLFFSFYFSILHHKFSPTVF